MEFTTKKVLQQDFGEYLAECRTRANFTLEEAAKFSGVQPKFVAALEGGRMQDLPAAVYVRGFLKSLARIYRIPEGPVLEQFTAETHLQSQVEAALSPRDVSRIPRRLLPRFVLTPKVLTIVGISLLGLTSLTYLYFQVSSLRRPPFLELTSPVVDGITASSHLVVEGRAESGATVTLNDQPIVVDTAGNFRENLSLGVGTNQLVVKAKNKFGQESAVARSIVFSGEKQIAGEATGVVVEVVMQDESAQVTVEADGAEVFSGTMLAGSTRTFAAQNRVVISTGNAGTTKVLLNGKDLGVLGKKGEALQNIEFGLE